MARWQREEREGGESQFGKGRYLAEVSKAREETKDGTTRFKVVFKKAEGDGAGEFLSSDLIPITGKHAWIGHRKLAALGFDMEGEGGVIEDHELIGRRCYLTLDWQTYQGDRFLKPVFDSKRNFGYEPEVPVEVAAPSTKRKKKAAPAEEVLPPENPLDDELPTEDGPEF